MKARDVEVTVKVTYDSTPLVLAEIGLETVRAGLKFGPQTGLPDGTGDRWQPYAEASHDITEENALAGEATWLDVLREEVYEAFAETDPEQLRQELIQVAAVAVRWAQALDARAAEAVVAGGVT